MAFDKKMLEVIACPLCKGKLQYVADRSELVCRFDRLAFPIKDNIPVMLENEARELSSDDLEKMDKN